MEMVVAAILIVVIIERVNVYGSLWMSYKLERDDSEL